MGVETSMKGESVDSIDLGDSEQVCLEEAVEVNTWPYGENIEYVFRVD